MINKKSSGGEWYNEIIEAASLVDKRYPVKENRERQMRFARFSKRWASPITTDITSRTIVAFQGQILC